MRRARKDQLPWKIRHASLSWMYCVCMRCMEFQRFSIMVVAMAKCQSGPGRVALQVGVRRQASHEIMSELRRSACSVCVDAGRTRCCHSGFSEPTTRVIHPLFLYSANSTNSELPGEQEKGIVLGLRVPARQTRDGRALCNAAMEADWRRSVDVHVPLDGAANCRSLNIAQAHPSTGQLFLS